MKTNNVVYMMKKSCLDKRKYGSLDIAKKQAKKYDKMFGNKSYVYWCSICGKYHLTTHKQEGVKYLNEFDNN